MNKNFPADFVGKNFLKNFKKVLDKVK